MRITSLLAVCLTVAATLAVPTHSRAADAPADPMDAAREELVGLRWAQAYDQFIAIANAEEAKNSRGDRWAQATFGAAVAISQGQPASKSRVERAAALYQALLQNAPKSRYAPRAMMNLGRLAELRDYPDDKPDLDGARQWYLKVVDSWPKEPIASEATLRAAATLVQAYDAPDFAKVKQGVAMLEQWIADHPGDPWTAIMWQYIGDTCFSPLKDYPKSLAAYDKVDAMGWTDKGNQGLLLWRCANIAERTSNRPRAIYYYTKVITDAPNSGKAYESQLALKRLGAPVPKINIFRKAAATTQPGEQ